MVNRTKTDTETPYNWGHFGVEVSAKWKCYEKDLIAVSMPNLDFYFNP